MGNIFYQDSLNLHKRNETMDSIKSIANFTPNFKTASFNKNYSANSLKLLTKDTISFGARISEKEEAVNTDWIDDKNIKKIITRIFSDGHARLTRKEILDLLRYFNYELKRNTGDEYYKHKYLDTNSIFRIKQEEPRPAISYTNDFKLALKNLNKTGGELLFVGSMPSDEEIAKFNSTIQNCPDEHKNPYRLKLEQHQKQQSQQSQIDQEALKQSRRMLENSCRAIITKAKESLYQNYYIEAKNLVNTYNQEFSDNESLQTALLEAEIKLEEIERKIDSIEYTEGDDSVSVQEKIDETEEEIALLWFKLNLTLENKINESQVSQYIN